MRDDGVKRKTSNVWQREDSVILQYFIYWVELSGEWVRGEACKQLFQLINLIQSSLIYLFMNDGSDEFFVWIKFTKFST